MRINHNLASLNIYREHERVISRQSVVMNRISSGFKINSAKEDPNGIAASEKMRLQIRGLEMAQRNAQDGMSMMQTADGALNEVSSMIQRIRELTIQSGSTLSDSDKEKIQGEITQMVKGIDNIIDNSEFNGKNLLRAGKDSKVKYDNNNPKFEKMPVGANVGETVDIPFFDLSSSNLGDENKKLMDLKGTGLKDLGIDECLSVIDCSMATVTSIRSKYGSLSNRFEGTYNEVNEMHDTIVGTESKIRDTDIAESMMNLARDNILIEAGSAMMVQANKFPQDALRVLEGLK
ncbi:flagellin [Clostridium botulinum]|uniref:Flagellin n=1 Tax=Clostridium botulinum C/D str. DC5 TaxID=1443128 RepID=A0A0A0ILP2_CLOBO|nr:flagellin [Clostridium botulinum]KGN01848.1 flagellin [Clostridium botulinum C/D str. DC5]KOC55704.1 flagellin [Clostridium botulinum]KOC57611.1 flagellin [Clostridium botulinum]MCD3232821.1 flagellin [Clostridium botulinum D/C]MCD3238683.1 flagellin [Clostridium botulinum D/C]